jgi:ABC-2 type transport system ATP-binding protein
MITVSNLSKKYPGRIAVDDISFEVNDREVVGFLGPNGSGKSTTMRMLCGYLSPSGGTARVAGFDVTRDPMEVRRRIGYLPENCPLYPELRVDEYLNFRAALKGVPRHRRRARIDEVKELCGLTGDGRRIIGQLSKGFRQRVGLAEAIVHEPELLILDEPTIGLDPGQMRHVRSLIQTLGKQHAILLSTHILSEVEAICRRVVIIKEGRIVASGPADQLARQQGGAARFSAEIQAPRSAFEEALGGMSDITAPRITALEADWLRLECSSVDSHDPRSALFALATARGWSLRELHREERRLEDLFIDLTDSGESANRREVSS